MAAAGGRDTARRAVLLGRRSRRVLLAVVGVAAAAVAGRVLYESSDELLTAADTLTRPRWSWVVVALVAEVASYLLRGAAYGMVLRAGLAASGGPGATGAGRPRPARGAVVLGAGALAGDAAAYCLPLGFAAAGVVMFRVLRRRGVDPVVAGWMYAMSTALYLGSIAALTVVAVQVAGGSNSIPGLRQVSLGALIGLTLIGVGYVLVRRGRGRQANAGPGVARAGERSGRRGGRAAGWLRGRLAELRRIRLPARTGVGVFSLMTASWLCNIAVLGVAYKAVHSDPPWAGLLLAYCAGQVAAAIPLTPGGIGVVEGSLTLALVAFGGAESVTLAAVLLYRLVTYWACIPLGGLAWLALRATGSADIRASTTTAPGGQQP